MNASVTISVIEVVGNSSCVAAEDGQRLHDQIAAVLRAGRRVELSFANVGSLVVAFLNVAIGQLYGEFGEGVLRANLRATNISPDDSAKIRLVVQTAKHYFANRKTATAGADALN